ncbi:hypothetical protein NQ176_g9663 [Zarea fungicola]|uniref:Uncharacterized protein n=1 Tax=Zarea fungicola TaxID=93591 RepID=A0ACC1MM64_9HYPO|nr:hypothetical protein NQ176_g9663 [Lecanicillium fungicola]
MDYLTAPMLSVGQTENVRKVTANLLPCRIYHDGSIEPIGSYWKPSDTTNGSKQAYFRGRKLQGTALPLPDGYHGLVVERAADQLKIEATTSADGTNRNGADEVIALETVGTMQATGEFDEMVVWSHESMATAAADPYVRTIEEWLQTSEKIHSFDCGITEQAK